MKNKNCGYEIRVCIDCKKDFNVNSNNQIRCQPCRKIERKELEKRNLKKFYDNNKQVYLDRARKFYKIDEFRKEIKNCIMCKISIEDRPSQAKYCLKCSKQVQKERWRKRLVKKLHKMGGK